MYHNTPITVGSLLKVEKGCNAIGITKGSTAQVKSITELGAEYSHSVRVELHFLNSFASGKTFRLYTRHINRLSDTFINFNNGNPSQKITAVRRG